MAGLYNFINNNPYAMRGLLSGFLGGSVPTAQDMGRINESLVDNVDGGIMTEIDAARIGAMGNQQGVGSMQPNNIKMMPNAPKSQLEQLLDQQRIESGNTQINPGFYEQKNLPISDGYIPQDPNMIPNGGAVPGVAPTNIDMNRIMQMINQNKNAQLPSVSEMQGFVPTQRDLDMARAAVPQTRGMSDSAMSGLTREAQATMRRLMGNSR